MKKDPRTGHRRLVPILMIVLFACAGAVMLRDQLSFAALAENRAALLVLRDDNYVLSAAGFMTAYALIVAFSLPGATVATLTGGFLFGLFPGVVFNVIAATLGACAIFLAVRWGLAQRTAAGLDMAGPRAQRLRAGLRENEIPVLLLLRLVPVVPFFVANLLPALAGVGLGRFAATTFLGIIPGALVYTWVGVGLGEVFSRGETPDLSIIFEPYILGPIMGLAVLAALPIVLRARREKDLT